MNHRSEVPSCASRPIEAVVWMSEIESAKCIVDLKTPYSIIGQKFHTNLEFLDPKTASGLKKIINEDFKRRVFIQEEAAPKEKRSLTGRHVAWRMYQYFKVRTSVRF